MPDPELFASERQELDRLHLSIWRTLHRMPNTSEVNEAHRPYHAAYAASRIQQLETLVGALLSLLLLNRPVTAENMFELMGEIYGGTIQGLELNAVIHNTAYHLVPRLKQEKED